MTPKRFIPISITLGVALCVLLVSSICHAEILNSASTTPLNNFISTERKSDLMHLLKQDCGSCHGMTMKGGLGPALLPENLSDKPDYVLVNTIKYGRETLAMPAWGNLLNTVEIEWLVTQLKEGIQE